MLRHHSLGPKAPLQWQPVIGKAARFEAVKAVFLNDNHIILGMIDAKHFAVKLAQPKAVVVAIVKDYLAVLANKPNLVKRRNVGNLRTTRKFSQLVGNVLADIGRLHVGIILGSINKLDRVLAKDQHCIGQSAKGKTSVAIHFMANALHNPIRVGAAKPIGIAVFLEEDNITG